MKNPQASPDQLWEQLPRPGQPRLLSRVELGKTRGGLPWKQRILPGRRWFCPAQAGWREFFFNRWRRLRPTQTRPQVQMRFHSVLQSSHNHNYPYFQWFKHGGCRAGRCRGWRSCRSRSWRSCQLLWLKVMMRRRRRRMTVMMYLRPCYLLWLKIINFLDLFHPLTIVVHNSTGALVVLAVPVPVPDWEVQAPVLAPTRALAPPALSETGDQPLDLPPPPPLLGAGAFSEPVWQEGFWEGLQVAQEGAWPAGFRMLSNLTGDLGHIHQITHLQVWDKPVSVIL